MKGVILAGGEGTRLRPFTYAFNKSLLPVYNKPMIFFPIFTLKRAGIKDIIIVCSPEHRARFVDLLQEGESLGLKIAYVTQDSPLGIANALGKTEDFAGGEKIVVILGDNIFEDDFTKDVARFDKSDEGAMIVLTRVKDPKRFGVVEFKGNRIIKVVEKPENPPSDLVSTGMFLYDENVFDHIKKLRPSVRGEYEITDLTNIYADEGRAGFVRTKGAWFDAGTFDSLLEAANFVARHPLLRNPDLLSDQQHLR